MIRIICSQPDDNESNCSDEEGEDLNISKGELEDLQADKTATNENNDQVKYLNIFLMCLQKIMKMGKQSLLELSINVISKYKQCTIL